MFNICLDFYFEVTWNDLVSVYVFVCVYTVSLESFLMWTGTDETLTVYVVIMQGTFHYTIIYTMNFEMQAKFHIMKKLKCLIYCIIIFELWIKMRHQSMSFDDCMDYNNIKFNLKKADYQVNWYEALIVFDSLFLFECQME